MPACFCATTSATVQIRTETRETSGYAVNRDLPARCGKEQRRRVLLDHPSYLHLGWPDAYAFANAAEFEFALTRYSSVLVMEEGQPDFIEQNLPSILRRADVATKVHGKEFLTMAGEYTGAVVTKGILKCVERYAPEIIDRVPQTPQSRRRAGQAPRETLREVRLSRV